VAPCYTHVSRSREARRVSVIRDTHLRMPHLHSDKIVLSVFNAQIVMRVRTNVQCVYPKNIRVYAKNPSYVLKTFEEIFTKIFSESRIYRIRAKFL